MAYRKILMEKLLQEQEKERKVEEDFVKQLEDKEHEERLKEEKQQQQQQRLEHGDEREAEEEEDEQQQHQGLNTSEREQIALANNLCPICSKEEKVLLINYGAVSCFSCRAFFRRAQNAILRSSKLTCSRNDNCNIDVNKQKILCRKCRFQKCLDAGMNAKLVLDKEGKQKRFKKPAYKYKTKIVNIGEGHSYDVADFEAEKLAGVGGTQEREMAMPGTAGSSDEDEAPRAKRICLRPLDGMLKDSSQATRPSQNLMETEQQEEEEVAAMAPEQLGSEDGSAAAYHQAYSPMPRPSSISPHRVGASYAPGQPQQYMDAPRPVVTHQREQEYLHEVRGGYEARYPVPSSEYQSSAAMPSSYAEVKPIVPVQERIWDLFDKTMVNPKLCSHLLGRVNQVQGRFQLCNLTAVDLKYLTESLTTQFYRFAYGLDLFQSLSSKKDQTMLLESNAPLFTQMILARALNSEDGFEQVNKLLADGISHTKDMLQGSISKLELSDFCRMTTLFRNDPCRETYYAATLAKLRQNSALSFAGTPILAALTLFWRGGMNVDSSAEIDARHSQLLNMCLENNRRVNSHDYFDCQKNLHFMSTLFSL